MLRLRLPGLSLYNTLKSLQYLVLQSSLTWLVMLGSQNRKNSKETRDNPGIKGWNPEYHQSISNQNGHWNLKKAGSVPGRWQMWRIIKEREIKDRSRLWVSRTKRMIIPLSKWRCYKGKSIWEKDYETQFQMCQLMYVAEGKHKEAQNSKLRHRSIDQA